MTSADKCPILMVDDRAENLTALAALLSEMELDLDLVSVLSGKEALRQSLRRDFAVILLDVQMPDMDGLETAVLLRANPKTRHLPIIFITAGMSAKSHQFEGYELGAVDYLVKPIEPVILRSKVRVFCELYALRTRLEEKIAERTKRLATVAKNLEDEIKSRQDADMALHESEMRMRSLIDSAYEAFIGMNIDGTIFEWNRQAESMFGWSRAEAMHRSVAELIIPEHLRSMHLRGLAHFITTGEGKLINSRVEQSAIRRDGHEFPIELSIWLIPGADRTIGAFVRDITERKRAEEELRLLNEELERRVEERSQELQQAMNQIVESEKLVSLGAIVAGVAHELNTPIGNIVTVVSSLEPRLKEIANAVNEGRLTKSLLFASVNDCNNACGMLIRSAFRANELIESFKNVAVDQTSSRRRVFDLRETIDDILISLGTTLRHAKATADLRIPDGIQMDSFPGALEQILNNLIINSLRHGFSEQGGHITIDASLHKGQVEIIYQDDGIGIDQEVRHKIFEPFYTTKLGQGGSGLGLFIVHNLVHGPLKGDIRIEGNTGKGARFVLSLPAVTP